MYLKFIFCTKPLHQVMSIRIRPLKMQVKKDLIKDGINTNEQLKIPRKKLESVPEGGAGVVGNIIYDHSRETFYGNTGTKWVPFNGNYAPNDAAFITATLSDGLLNERVLTAGSNISIVDGGANAPITIGTPSITLTNGGSALGSLVCDGSGPILGIKALNQGTGINLIIGPTDVTIAIGGAPPVVDATFVTMSTSGGLSQERVLTAGSNISITDGGAKQPVTISTPSITLANVGSGVTLVSDSSGPELAVKSLNAGSGISIVGNGTSVTIGLSISSTAAPFDASFITVNSEPGLSKERALTAGINISIVDGGANSVITIDTTYKRTVVNSSPYTVLESDDILAVFPLTATIQINLPLINSLTTPNKYKRYTIVDEGGNSANNPIYVVAASGNSIIGTDSVAVNQNYNSINVYTDGVSKWFLN